MGRYLAILPVLFLGLTVSGHVPCETSALSQSAASPLSQSASQAAVCSGCHGSASGAAVPVLVADALVLERQMLALKQARGDSAMHRLIHAYDDAQIRRIAEFLATTATTRARQSNNP